MQPANQVSNTWAVYYNFDQYLWHPEGDPKRGIGVFFRFGASDGVANPVKYATTSASAARGGPGAPHDNFGIGWARTELSDNFVPVPASAARLGLDHEDAVELYYNAAITKWLRISLDLQVINPGLQKTLSDDRNAEGREQRGRGWRAHVHPVLTQSGRGSISFILFVLWLASRPVEMTVGCYNSHDTAHVRLWLTRSERLRCCLIIQQWTSCSL